MRKCEEYELAISCYVDGELGSAELQKVFSHLAQCEACSGFLEKAIRIRVEAAKEMRQKVVERSPDATSPGWRGVMSIAPHHRLLALIRRRIAIPVPVAVAAVILLFFLTLTLNQQPQPVKPAPAVHPPLPEQVTTLPVVRIP